MAGGKIAFGGGEHEDKEVYLLENDSYCLEDGIAIDYEEVEALQRSHYLPESPIIPGVNDHKHEDLLSPDIQKEEIIEKPEKKIKINLTWNTVILMTLLLCSIIAFVIYLPISKNAKIEECQNNRIIISNTLQEYAWQNGMIIDSETEIKTLLPALQIYKKNIGELQCPSNGVYTISAIYKEGVSPNAQEITYQDVIYIVHCSKHPDIYND